VTLRGLPKDFGEPRVVLQLKLKRRPHQLLRHVEQLLSQRHQFFRRQATMAFVHRLG
jgi:hypothetical protein